MVNSSVWKPDIIRLINGIFESVQKVAGGQFVCFDYRRHQTIFDNYERNLAVFKESVYGSYSLIAGNEEEEHLVDRHKIASLYIKSILQSPPVWFDEEKFGREKKGIENIRLNVRLIREFSCMLLAKYTMTAWNSESIDNYRFEFPAGYEEHILKLIYHYNDRPDDFPVLAFSHLLYLLEALNLACRYDLRKQFYRVSQ